jgi:FkbM family methyltransferase
MYSRNLEIMVNVQSHLRAWIRRNSRLKSYLINPYTWILHTRWWIRSRIFNLPYAIDFAHFRMKLWPEGSIAEPLYNGHFELSDRHFISSYLKPGMRVVDAGANIGLYTVMASILTGPSGHVYAFEPGKKTFSRLHRNLLLNNCQNVIANNVALANKCGEMILRVDPNHPTSDAHCFVDSLHDTPQIDPTDEVVKCQKLDNHNLGHIDFIKIDVEGGELALLEGAEQTLLDSPDVTLLLECTKHRKQVQGFMERLGFHSFLWDDQEHTLKPAVFEKVVATSNVVLRRQP